MTDKFKQECSKPSYANRLGKIKLSETEFITSEDYLSFIEIVDDCYSNGKIIGTTNSKNISIKTLNNYELFDKQIHALIGVKYADLSEEYINIGKYTISKPNNDETASIGEYKGYDDLDRLNEPYVCGIDNWDNVTLKDVMNDLCSQLGLVFKNTSFINDDLPVEGNLFKNNEKRKDVLSDIAECACSFVDIDWNTNEIEFKWFSEDVVDTITKDDYTSLEKNQQYGPINLLSIKESQIEGENIVLKDDDSINSIGEKEIAIIDNFFLYTEKLRKQASTKIWERVKGFTYFNCKLTTPIGRPYLHRGDKIKVQADDGTYFETYVLKHTFSYDGTFKSIIESPSLTQTETKIKNDGLKARFTRVEIISNKNEEKIQQIIEVQDEQSNQLSKVEQDINSVQNLFQITGGSNDIKNSAGLFDNDYWENSEAGEFERGYDYSLIGYTISNSKIGVKNGITKTSSANIINLLVGEVRNLSFKISNDSNTITTIRLKGNTTLIEETIDYECTLKEFSYQYVPDSPNLILEIESSSDHDGWSYVIDLMSNSGDKKNWEPSRDEIIGTTLKLSQQGLTVYCTGSDIATLMTSQGFQVREFRNGELYEIITKFTDKGIDTKDITCIRIDINKAVKEVINVNGHEVVIEYLRGGSS